MATLGFQLNTSEGKKSQLKNWLQQIGLRTCPWAFSWLLINEREPCPLWAAPSLARSAREAAESESKSVRAFFCGFCYKFLLWVPALFSRDDKPVRWNKPFSLQGGFDHGVYHNNRSKLECQRSRGEVYLLRGNSTMSVAVARRTGLSEIAPHSYQIWNRHSLAVLSADFF